LIANSRTVLGAQERLATLLHHHQGQIKVVWVPGGNIERGPFLSIYEKLNERIEVLVILKQMKLEQKKRITN